MRNLSRDSIDFGRTDIRRLFAALFIPTLIGMICNSVLNIADGIIVGQGIGSDALAAVNISAPLYVITSAVALLFGSGVSVIAAIHLARGNTKAADINVTQALFIPLLLMAIVGICMLTETKWLNYLFGGSDLLYGYFMDYIVWLSPMPILMYVDIVGGFVIRLDGSPKVAMYVNAVPAVMNMILDYVFVFPLGAGIKGAAIATVTSMVIGAIMIFVYLLKYSRNIHLYKLKFTPTGIYLTARNLLYMAKAGMSTFIAEISLSVMIVIGNHMFMRMLHEDGVAAFSVACYLFPLIFMFGNSIAQSQLPIISYNLGKGYTNRIRKTIRLSVTSALILGAVITSAGIWGCNYILMAFLDKTGNAYRIAATGFPIFSVGFLFITLNVVLTGYFQSLEKITAATFFTLLRGVIFMIPCFILMPIAFGDRGLWGAVPAAEILTLFCIIGYGIAKRK